MPEDAEAGGSPACFAHELVGGHVVDGSTRRDVGRFRRAERERLYALRRGMAAGARAEQTARVIEALRRQFDGVSGGVIGGYWPIRGELDLRPWLAEMQARGVVIGLPVVIAKGQPVEFHRWSPTCAMTRGIWNIPVPEAAEPVVPDQVIVPLVGIDRGCFRLGNGGGYYDMTLAAMAMMPRRIAVGQDFCRIETIFPQPWDIGMDLAILGDGTEISAA